MGIVIEKEQQLVKHQNGILKRIVFEFSGFHDDKIYFDNIELLINMFKSIGIKVYGLNKEDNYYNHNLDATYTYSSLEARIHPNNFVDKASDKLHIKQYNTTIIFTSNPEIVKAFDDRGYLTCLINSNYNDTISHTPYYEVSSIDKVKKLILNK